MKKNKRTLAVKVRKKYTPYQRICFVYHSFSQFNRLVDSRVKQIRGTHLRAIERLFQFAPNKAFENEVSKYFWINDLELLKNISIFMASKNRFPYHDEIKSSSNQKTTRNTRQFLHKMIFLKRFKDHDEETYEYIGEKNEFGQNRNNSIYWDLKDIKDEVLELFETYQIEKKEMNSKVIDNKIIKLISVK